ncbi:DUF4148 domain-containing protein [Burkholderia sp. AU31624]|uniref:DUF4148 domain-containing protein n=1 Tax=Burkholderia sp. AU31624 TaxID=2879629 RepID=UPI001CF2E68B|nr:DUF4148 domain-containing protein [Burkholderia sp. AU31624]MCA8256885.1 DUF4148 domain-containing protein [Burkholderia sp. AU31624]
MNKVPVLNFAVSLALVVFVTDSAQAQGGNHLRPDRSIPHSVSLSTAEQADGRDGVDTGKSGGFQTEGVGPASVKTRAQVQAEILQAGEAGLLPTPRFDYPPGAETRARNRVRFLRLEDAWQAN